MPVTQQYEFLSVTLKNGERVNLRGQGFRFAPRDSKSAVVRPPMVRGRVRLKSVRYRITARKGRFKKSQAFQHKIDCDLSASPGKKQSVLRSRCGKLFIREPLNFLLDSRKFGNTKGVQFVA